MASSVKWSEWNTWSGTLPPEGSHVSFETHQGDMGFIDGYQVGTGKSLLAVDAQRWRWQLPEEEPLPLTQRDSPAEQRKQRPLYRGLISYFPDACLEVANCSFIANEQHNPGEPMHWAKEKSTDHEDCILRHMTDRAKGEVRDTDKIRHLAKAAWRALAALQTEIESERAE